MKVAVIHPRMSVLGGAERVAIHSLKAGLRAGNHVSLISEDFDPNKVEQFFACKGLFSEVERLTYPPFRPTLIRSLLLYRQILYHHRRVQKIVSKEHDFQLLLSTQDIGYVPTVSVPVVHYCYFPDYFSHLQSDGSSLWNLFYWPARRYYHGRVNHVDKFLATSDYTKEFVKKIWGRDSITLYPPCPVDLYESKVQAKENLVVTVARMVPEKRIEDFLEIASRLPAVRFVVIGRTQTGREEYFDRIRRSAPINTSILDAPLREVSDVLAKAKVYVHCARNEQFGITIIEAMAAGCVPVVHDSGGPQEIVAHNIGYRWETVDEAVDKIKVLIEDENLRGQMSRASIERSQSFSTDRFEIGLLDVLAKYYW